LGRKALAGFPYLAVVTALVIAAGCRQTGSTMPDPASSFSPSGEVSSRELGIYSGTVRVGDMQVSLKNGTWDGLMPAVEAYQRVLLRVSFKGQGFTIDSGQSAWVGDGLDLLGSAGWMDFGAGRWEFTARSTEKGRFESVQRTAFGKPSRDTISLPDGALASDVLPFFLARQPSGGESGGEIALFNLNLGQEIPLTWSDGGQTPFGRLFTVSYWGMEERIWLDDKGLVAREEMLLGVQAREPGEGETQGNLPLESVLSMASVPANGVPPDLASLDEAVFALEGTFRRPPEGPWQKVSVREDRTLVTVSRPRIEAGPDDNPGDVDGVSDPFALDLDSPAILELAGRITEGKTRSWDKGVAICQWVYRNLEKTMRESFSALQVLGSGEGECQSHSLLAVSLCRASGVPARFAYGVVFLPDRGAFFFHTWVEIHAGEWIPMDPTLGHFPSGADRLTLAVGGYRDQFRIFPYIMGNGGWRITFVED